MCESKVLRTSGQMHLGVLVNMDVEFIEAAR